MPSPSAPRKPRLRRASVSKPYPVRDEDDFPADSPTGDPFAGVVLREDALQPLRLAYRDDARGVWLYQGDCLEVLDALNAKYPEGRFDAIFADPPYFLS